MARTIKVAAAQVGAVHRSTPRSEVLSRLIKLVEQAAERGVKLVVFPETTFTTFFPRYYITDESELASYFEVEGAEGVTGSANVASFFSRARELGVDVQIGYGEDTGEGKRYNTAVYVSGKSGQVLGKYRKVHLPGTVEPFDLHPDTTNQLEKRYFLPGNLGFPAFRATSLRDAEGNSPIIGQLICNDRRWAEGWRCYGLQGVEILCCGYNTTAYAPKLWGGDQNITREKAYAEAMFHHKLVVQAHAYTNSMFCITAARAGVDDGLHPLIPGSMIVDPEGHIVAESQTQGDELVVATIDLDDCRQGKERTFNLGKHRRVEAYGRLVQEGGVVPPPEPTD